MKKYIEYKNIKYKFIKIKYKNSDKTNIIKGKCFCNPLKPSLKGSACILVHNIGVLINEVHGSLNNEYYYTNYIPLYKIKEIDVIKNDVLSPVLLAWIGKKKNIPIDILKYINKFMKGWINEINVYDLKNYQ